MNKINRSKSHNSIMFPGNYTSVSGKDLSLIVLAIGVFIALPFLWHWVLGLYMIIAFVLFFGG